MLRVFRTWSDPSVILFERTLRFVKCSKESKFLFICPVNLIVIEYIVQIINDKICVNLLTEKTIRKYTISLSLAIHHCRCK